MSKEAMSKEEMAEDEMSKGEMSGEMPGAMKPGSKTKPGVKKKPPHLAGEAAHRAGLVGELDGIARLEEVQALPDSRKIADPRQIGGVERHAPEDAIQRVVAPDDDLDAGGEAGLLGGRAVGRDQGCGSRQGGRRRRRERGRRRNVQAKACPGEREHAAHQRKQARVAGLIRPGRTDVRRGIVHGGTGRGRYVQG